MNITEYSKLTGIGAMDDIESDCQGERKTYSARVLLDSISIDNVRLTTYELTYWRAIHSEFMTYRTFSRNAASSRAIPVRKILRQVWKNPAGPVYYGKNQKGMEAEQELQGWRKWLAIKGFYLARYPMILFVLLLVWVGLHKQVANRLLEPWMWITTIMSATEIEHMWRQRIHTAAQPEFKYLCVLAQGAQRQSKPVLRTYHTPLIRKSDVQEIDAMYKDQHSVIDINGQMLYPIDIIIRISVARCARVSYLTHDGKRSIIEDLKLYNRLRDADPPHTSPFEHVAMAGIRHVWSGNFRGWIQHREVVDQFFINRQSVYGVGPLELLLDEVAKR